MALAYTVKLSVIAQATGDTNAPTKTTVASGLAARLTALKVQVRAAMASGFAEGQSPSHVAYCDDNAALQIGRELIVTEQRAIGGAWASVANSPTYLILGKGADEGAPWPGSVVRLEVMQVSPAV